VLNQDASILYFKQTNISTIRITLPKITVYLVTKNRFRLLKLALASIEAQTFRDFELIVVDDGSSDETSAYLKDYKSSFEYQYFRNETSLGAPSARNRAIQAAKGEFITGLDDDDRFHEQRLEKLLHAWDNRLALVTSEDYFEKNNRLIRWNKPAQISLDTLLYRNLIGNQIFTRTQYVREVGGFDPNLVAAQDYDLWVRLLKCYGDAHVVREPLQFVNTNDSADDRISTGVGRKWGYYQFYCKHKALMNPAQRRYQLYSVKRAQEKSPGLMSIFTWVPRKYWLKELAKRFYST
jgi:glycosyltransferase involved in cell wall biosynthesis